MVFYSAAFFLYTSTLLIALSSRFLPTHSDIDATIAILSSSTQHRAVKDRSKYDLSRDPFVALLLLTVYFVGTVLVVDIGNSSDGHVLPVPRYQYAVAALAVVLPICTALLRLTTLVLYLDTSSLLTGVFKKGFAITPYCNVSSLLIVATEVSVIATSVLLYGLLDR
jgi:hypothetical protein